MSSVDKNIFDELENSIKGEIYTDKVRRYMHSTDGSYFRIEPSCIVYPKDSSDVQKVVEFANKYGLSVHGRGAGSGLCGAAIGRGIVIDFCKYMNKLISYERISENEAIFTCEPGYRYGELEKYLKKNKTGMWFPPSPSSGEYATFGGMYGTNAGGSYSVKYGNVADYLVDAEVVFSDGSISLLSDIENTNLSDLKSNFKEIYDIVDANKEMIEKSYPPIICNVAGYDLRKATTPTTLRLHKILGGSEGTLGISTKLTFKVIKQKPFNSLVIAYFDNKTNSSLAAQIGLKFDPAGIEIMDKSLLSLAVTHEPSLEGKIPTDIDNVLMFEFEGDSFDEVKAMANETLEKIKSEGLSDRVYTAMNEEEKAQFWAVRKAAVPILYLLRGKKKILALVEDAAVPTDKLVEYFNGLNEIFSNYKVDFVSYGHIAKGLLHNRPLLDLKDPHDVGLLQPIADDVFDLVYRLNGTISGEHGDGRLRSCYIHKQYNSDLYSLFIKVKNILDPENIFNPDIKTSEDPAQMAKHLRYGVDYGAQDPEVNKQLVWNEDFILEAEKCHGCSKCTTVTTATRMCPIYKATRDESAAPKAKANILRGLLSGAISDKAMYEETFQYVMNRCVNCGSCSIECPSKVNIPKLALEAKSRYANKFGVPLEAKIETNLALAAKLTHKFSPVTSVIMKPKFTRKLMEITTGITGKREFVNFPTKSLSERINEVEGSGNSKKALYFTGCYAEHMKPEVGESTVSVLNKLGYEVITPKQFCCGIPHLSKGMAKAAREQIKKNINSWGKLIEEVDVIVTACSSCALSLTKEWLYYQNDEMTEKIKNKTKFVMELIDPLLENSDLFNDTKFSVAYHQPCHMRLMKDSKSTIRALQKNKNVTVDNLDSGCCGMAGSWGMSAKNYDLSVKIGGQLNEKLTESDAAIGVTECPTCTMQMEHLSNKPVMHPIEVVDKCLKK